MDFIFMLTRNDSTVEDCLEMLDLVRPLGLTHMGFKDVGVDRETLRRLAEGIRATGAVVHLEVVSTSPEACLNSARTAVELGVDRLMGGTDVAAIQAVVAGSNTRYYPFPGRPYAHPTKLGGSPTDVELDCRQAMAQGCAGVDLLAYRATEAAPVDLIHAARRGLGDGYLIIAGSVASPQRIAEVAAAGADAFTIGSAIFDGAFSPTKGSILSQLRDVTTACRQAAD